MKTSVIEVRDMLSVLSVLGVEKIISKVPGVESVTVNFAAGSATVRYDETSLKASEIKAAVHQLGSASEEADSLPPEPIQDKVNSETVTPTPVDDPPAENEKSENPKSEGNTNEPSA